MPSSNPCPPSLSFWQRSDEAAFRGEFSSHTPTQVSLLVWAGSCLRLSFQIATPAPAVCRTLYVPGVRGEEHWLLMLALTLISHHELRVTSQIFSKLRGDSAASSVKGVPFWNTAHFDMAAPWARYVAHFLQKPGHVLVRGEKSYENVAEALGSPDKGEWDDPSTTMCTHFEWWWLGTVGGALPGASDRDNSLS